MLVAKLQAEGTEVGVLNGTVPGWVKMPVQHAEQDRPTEEALSVGPGWWDKADEGSSTAPGAWPWAPWTGPAWGASAAE